MKGNYKELQIEEDMQLTARNWIFQRIGWVLMLLLVIAAVLGFTGGGGVPGISTATAGGKAAGIEATYERYLRKEAPAELKISLYDVQGPEQQLRFSKDFYEKLQVEQVVPEPKDVQIGNDAIVYTFKASGEEARLIFYLKPLQAGSLNVAVDNGKNKLTLSQFVYP